MCLGTGSGYNARFFSGYKPEDFIGRFSIICGAANNNNVEFIALRRFYLGQLCTQFPGFRYDLPCFFFCVFLKRLG